MNTMRQLKAWAMEGTSVDIRDCKEHFKKWKDIMATFTAGELPDEETLDALAASQPCPPALEGKRRSRV